MERFRIEKSHTVPWILDTHKGLIILQPPTNFQWADQETTENTEEALKVATDCLNKLTSSEEQKTDYNAALVSEFMNHCKIHGYELPDSIYESFFNA